MFVPRVTIGLTKTAVLSDIAGIMRQPAFSLEAIVYETV